LPPADARAYPEVDRFRLVGLTAIAFVIGEERALPYLGVGFVAVIVAGYAAALAIEFAWMRSSYSPDDPARPRFAQTASCLGRRSRYRAAGLPLATAVFVRAASPIICPQPQRAVAACSSSTVLLQSRPVESVVAQAQACWRPICRRQPRARHGSIDDYRDASTPRYVA
jgi:hypothetical protein